MQGSSLARDTWNAATELLRAEGKLSDSQIAFVRLAQPLAIVDDKLLLGTGSEFVKTWLLTHVSEVMTKQISEILGYQVTLNFSVDTSLSENKESRIQKNDTNYEYDDFKDSEEINSTNNFQDSHLYNARDLDSHFSAQTSTQNFTQNSIEENSLENLQEQKIDFTNSANSNENFDDIKTSSNKNYDYSPSGLTLPEIPSITTLQAQARLNPRYIFDTFVIGESNRFAHATALAVSEAPGSTYNPLFLYSDSGMGKTHLLHAIGNYTVSLYPNKKVLYISSEEFTNAFINALRDNKIYSFKDQFRNVDVLLIDDIQFISNRASTIEEFFHTFNALSNANKQIVITSDVAPKFLQGFEERMISRFASGITASIDLPNLETRIAILEKKSAAEHLHVPRPVLEFIASKMTTNVREMEGALRRIAAFADLSRQAVSLEMAQLVLKDMITDRESVQVTAGIIMAQTASYFDISLEDLKSPVRTRSFTMPRHIAMYLCREMTDYSLPKIAELFDRRDHTTVLNALRKVEKQMTEKQTIFNQVSELTTRIKNAAKEQS